MNWGRRRRAVTRAGLLSAVEASIFSALWAATATPPSGRKPSVSPCRIRLNTSGLDVNRSLLTRLAERTGGQVLQADSPEEAAGVLFSPPQGGGRSAAQGQPLNDFWPWFVLAALCVFVAEIAVRQISLPASWTARWQNRQPPQPAGPSYSYEELEAIVHRRAEDHRRRSIDLRAHR